MTKRTGLAVAPLQDGDRTVALPMDRVWNLGVGATHHYSENLDISHSFVWSDLGDATVANNFVVGHYRKNDLYLLGISLAWKKLPWSGRASF
jgi:hypothetical protein